MKVTTYIINEGADDQIIFLVNAKDGTVVKTAPNDWKTKRGAIRWSLNNGFEFVPEMEQEKEPEETSKVNMEELAVLTERISKLEEKLQSYEDAFRALRKIFMMTETK